MYYETGQYDKSLEALQNLALNINDATSGYGLVLLVQARTIKGETNIMRVCPTIWINLIR